MYIYKKIQSMRNNIGEILYEKFGTKTPKFPNTAYKIISISKKSFRKFSENEKQPRLDELERIANWLGVNPKELY